MNMNISYHPSFYFFLYHETNPICLPFEVKWLNSHIFYELGGCKDVSIQEIMDTNYREIDREEEMKSQPFWDLSYLIMS